MNAREWREHLTDTEPSRQTEQDERSAASLTIEFSQPLVESHRRKKRRKRAVSLPLIGQQKELNLCPVTPSSTPS